VPGVSGTYVYPFAPGGYQIDCNGSLTAFAVVDPDRFYTTPQLSCDVQGSGTTGGSDYGEGATGPRGPVLGIARMELRGLEPGDVVEHAGYAAAVDDQLVRVVRDGMVVAVLGYSPDGQGGWLLVSTRTCPGSDITTVIPGG
jgi:hypothetical protein